jgi:hypothetical protein
MDNFEVHKILAKATRLSTSNAQARQSDLAKLKLETDSPAQNLAVNL